MTKDPQQQLLDAIAGGRAPHAVFLDCADTPLTAALARRAAALFCFGTQDIKRLEGFPDYYELDEPTIKVDSIRELTGALANRPFAEGGRAIVILDAHRMNENAQNALLKSLEEPPERTLFLLTGNRAGLLPTICSRCQTLHLAASPETIVTHLTSLGASRRDAELYAAQGGTLLRALRLYDEEDYRAFRTQARTAFYLALGKGGNPYQHTKALSTDVDSALAFMLGAVEELIRCRETGAVPTGCEDAAALAKLSSRFTSGQLNAIISLLAEAAQRATISHQGGAALDRLFACIGKTVLEA